MNLSEKEKMDWIELCNYIKYELLGYSTEMKLPKYLILRLRGFSEGNFIANKKISSNAHYTYEEILTTCKLCRLKIRKYFNDNSAKISDEKHKINLIFTFIENDINDVVLRLRQNQNVEKNVKKLSLEHNMVQAEYKNEYKAEDYRIEDKFNKLW